jgi:OFA family oxalate/formate antiporter-like MFS transporter
MNQDDQRKDSLSMVSSADNSRSAVSKRWTVLLAGFLLALMGGLSYTWGVNIRPIAQRFGWSTVLATAPFTMFMVVFAIAMVPAGKLQDKFGPRRVAGAGALLFVAAYGLSALVGRFPSAGWLIATYGVLGGIACGLTYACVAPPVRKWYPDRPAFAVSVSVMGFGLAALFFAPLKAAVLIPRFGIEGMFLIEAAMTGSVSILAACLIRNPPSGLADLPHAATRSAQHVRDASPTEMVHDPVFWLLWAGLALVVAGGLMSIGLIPSFGSLVLGLTPSRAALATSVFAGVNGFGRPLAGFMGDRFGSGRVMIVTCTLEAAAFFLFTTVATDRLSLYIMSAFLGWGMAATLALFPTLTASRFGTAHLGVDYGFVFTAFGVGALAPTVGALVYDATGSYAPVFFSAGVLAATALALFVVLRRKYHVA